MVRVAGPGCGRGGGGATLFSSHPCREPVPCASRCSSEGSAPASPLCPPTAEVWGAVLPAAFTLDEGGEMAPQVAGAGGWLCRAHTVRAARAQLLQNAARGRGWPLPEGTPLGDCSLVTGPGSLGPEGRAAQTTLPPAGSVTRRTREAICRLSPLR